MAEPRRYDRTALPGGGIFVALQGDAMDALPGRASPSNLQSEWVRHSCLS